MDRQVGTRTCTRHFPGSLVPKLSECETHSSQGTLKGAIFWWAYSANILSGGPWHVQVHSEESPRDPFRVRPCVDLKPVLKQPWAHRQLVGQNQLPEFTRVPSTCFCLFVWFSFFVSLSLLSKSWLHFNWKMPSNVSTIYAFSLWCVTNIYSLKSYRISGNILSLVSFS